MSLLIIGGLLAVAVIALVAVAFVLMSEKPQPSNNSEQQAAPPSPPEPAAQEVVEQTTPVAHEPVAEAAVPQTEWYPLANGQLIELTNEVLALHRQAKEFEQRVSVLADMVEHMEQGSNGYMNHEELPTHITGNTPYTR